MNSVKKIGLELAKKDKVVRIIKKTSLIRMTFQVIVVIDASVEKQSIGNIDVYLVYMPVGSLFNSLKTI